MDLPGPYFTKAPFVGSIEYVFILQATQWVELEINSSSGKSSRYLISEEMKWHSVSHLETGPYLCVPKRIRNTKNIIGDPNRIRKNWMFKPGFEQSDSPYSVEFILDEFLDSGE
jgi:hypothetical protein